MIAWYPILGQIRILHYPHHYAHVGRTTSYMGYAWMMELYHLINRGVDGRDIFLDTQDYARFVHDLYEFNDTAPALEFHHANARTSNVGRRTSYIRERLVDIHGWELMKNHYHLLMSERVDNGLTLFLRKLSGYARYFNERHGRQGALLQGRTKRIRIERHEHFLYVLHYVHLNGLDYLPGAEQWRERDKGSLPKISYMLDYLRTYRWGSYLDYCGVDNFPSILTKSLFESSPGEYVTSLKEYLSDRSCDDDTKELLFEYD